MGTNKQTAGRWTALSLWAVGFAEGRRYRAWVPPWQREVYAVCGVLATTVPIIVQYRRGRGRQIAKRMAQRIKSWGYRSVRVECEPWKQTAWEETA